MDSVGRYKIVRELGRGATGVVYQGIDPNIGRPLAIKVIQFPPEFAEDVRHRLRYRLLREARSVGMLSHPAIITIYDVEEQPELAYIAMEFVQGSTLKELIGGAEPIPGDLFFRVLKQTAGGLDYAHQRGVVHRDIKPANLMIADSGTVKIADFGVAKFNSAGNLSMSGAIVGTPQYMAPEQTRGEDIDGRCDQYALAVLAYEILAGEKPFQGETLAAMIKSIVNDQPRAPHLINATLSTGIDNVLLKGMAKERNGRYGTCREFVDDLERACATTPRWMVMNKTSPAQTWVSASGMAFPMAPTPKPAAPKPSAQAAAPAAAAAEPPHPQSSFTAVPEPEHLERTSPRRRRLWPFLLAALMPGALAALVFWHPDSPPAATGSTTGSTGATAASTSNNTSAASRNPGSRTGSSTAATRSGMAGKDTGAASGASSTIVKASPWDDNKSNRPAGGNLTGSPVNTQTSGVVTGRTKGPAPKPALPQEVTITTTPPGATAKLDSDSDKTCSTPCTLTVAQGPHKLTVEMVGYSIRSRDVFVGTDPVTVANIALEAQTGTLMIGTLPSGMTIYVDGRQVQPGAVNLPVGPHRVLTELNGVRNEETVEIHEGIRPYKVSVH